jgi:hypothetical protein
MSELVKIQKDRYYWVTPEGGGTLVCAKWLGDKWEDVKPPKASIEHEQVKQITTISGSKYNYTEQVGDSLISYGFDALEEMKRFVVSKRNSDDEERTLKL